ncbi:MAG: hypothetical protein GXN93_01970 [Candidatus Diapherotrites archaeon]|nr:hypothetical protein [Candidatus Diapherotrites archaeon]
MEEWMKYLMWIGWILAVIGFFVGAPTVTWFALINLIIGIIIGIVSFSKEIKGIEERAIFYGVMWLVAMAFPMGKLIGFTLMAWFKAYLGLMAYMYMPAAILQYISKLFKEGY